MDDGTAGNHEQYFIRVRGKVLGPFTLEKLKSLRSRGQFSRIHEVSTDRTTWQPATMLEPLLGVASVTSLIEVPEKIVERSAMSRPTEPGPGARWHYSAGGERHGPVSIIELRELIRAGLLANEDLVWREGLPDWIPVYGAAELRSLTKSDTLPVIATSPGVPTPADDGIHHTSGFATASIVLGILGLMTPFLIFNILATIFGSVALKAIAKSRIPLGGRGMALSGLVMGIVGLAVWGMLILFWTGILATVIGAGFKPH